MWKHGGVMQLKIVLVYVDYLIKQHTHFVFSKMKVQDDHTEIHQVPSILKIMNMFFSTAGSVIQKTLRC